MDREITTGTYWFYRGRFDRAGMDMEIVLDKPVDGDVLQAAAEKTLRRFPFLRFTCRRSEDDTRYLLRENTRPFSAVSSPGFVSFDDPRAAGFLWTLGYSENQVDLRRRLHQGRCQNVRQGLYHRLFRRPCDLPADHAGGVSLCRARLRVFGREGGKRFSPPRDRRLPAGRRGRHGRHGAEPHPLAGGAALWGWNLGQALHLLITLALTALSFVFTPALVDLILKADAETKRISVSCIRCMLLQMPVYVAFEMITSYLQSIGHRKEANTMSFLGNTLLYLPLVALLGLRFRAEGVILSTPIALLLTLAVFYARRSLKPRRPVGLRDIMHVSECIHPEEIHVAARCTVQTIEDAVRCSEEIRTGLLGKGADKRTAFLLSLFVEEICSNIIEHGFRKSDAERRLFASHPYAASVFAFLHDGVITLRIYDNCILFDPREKLRSIEEREKDPERGLGLKLIFAMADEASYTSLLNMNHMLIRLPLRGSAASSEKGKKTLTCYDERFSS